MKFNKTHLLLIAILFCYNGYAQEQFSYKRQITPAAAENGWNTIVLPHDMFSRVQKDFSDLRIYDLNNGDTSDVPYLLDILDTEIKKQEIVLPSINESRSNGKYFLTFENTGFKVNLLELRFMETEYFATVRVEGSNDKNTWLELADNEKIFSVDNEYEGYASSVINFPLTDYKFIKLTISSPDKLTFSHAVFRLDEIKPGVFDDVPTRLSVTTSKKSKRTVLELALGEVRPVSNIDLQIDDQQDYYRQIIIESLIDSTQTEKGWIRNYESISGNLITSFRPNHFAIPFTLTNRLRIIIENYDNSPLNVRGVKVSGARVQLRSQIQNKTAYLFYGNNRVNAPTYDLDHFRDKTPLQNPEATLGPEEKIIVEATPVSAIFENKMWLWGIIIAAIALLGFFTLRMMKSQS